MYAAYPVILEKSLLRQRLLARRDGIASQDHAMWSQAISARLVAYAAAELAQNDIVALYAPRGSEVAIGGAAQALVRLGFRLALPVVMQDRVLRFRVWEPSAPLVEGRYGIPTPLESTECVTPALVVTPLLGADEACHRLGYGKGHYDATLQALRRETALLAVGAAFSCQIVSELPTQAHDQRLDAIIQENTLMRA